MNEANLKNRMNLFIEFGMYYHAGVIAAILQNKTVDVFVSVEKRRTDFMRYHENGFVRLFDEGKIPEIELVKKSAFMDDELIYTFKAKEV